jgi:uncharacterized protein YbbC (DUF1343 family)
MSDPFEARTIDFSAYLYKLIYISCDMKLNTPIIYMLLMLVFLPVALCAQVTLGAARTSVYVPMLKDKRIALLSNHTGMVSDKHTLDIMLDNGLNVTTIFSPEHGFRGNADAGEHIANGKDAKTGIPIASLYNGKTRMPAKSVMDNIDVIVTDIQDVGLRFYTYYCTMIDLMNAAAAYGKEFVVLDRPNPNGMSVDGPVLDMKYASGVGRLPIPTLHGMTLGELALMANGEGWLKNGAKVPLEVVECEGYTHATRYKLPIAPSPNLPDMKAVYMYPSTCYFEATDVSLGRGTDTPFTIYGHPAMKEGDYYFTPASRPGAKTPPQLGKRCRGRNLRSIPEEQMIAQGVNFEYIIDAYRAMGKPAKFFTSFFELLAGNGKIRAMIERGASAQEIKASWADDVKAFKARRKPYLLYPES